MGWRVVLAQRTPPNRAVAKRRSQAELGAAWGRDAEFTERSWGGSQRRRLEQIRKGKKAGVHLPERWDTQLHENRPYYFSDPRTILGN